MILRGQALLAAGAVALGLTAVAAGAAEEHARGGSGSPSEGSAGGFQYRSHQENIPPDTVRTIRANCPAGKPVVSGGTRVFFNSSYIEEAYPFDDSDSGSRPDDGYETKISNLDANDPAPARVYAICKAKDTGVRYARATRDDGATTATAQCPGATRATGGGATYDVFILTRQPDLFQSRPVGGDTWRAGILTGANDQATTTHAICMKPGARKIVYRQSTNDIEPSSTGNDQVLCPAKKKTIGGGFHTNGDGTSLTSVFPFDTLDAGDVPDDGFESRIRNDAGGERLLSVYAVCR